MSAIHPVDAPLAFLLLKQSLLDIGKPKLGEVFDEFGDRNGEFFKQMST